MLSTAALLQVYQVDALHTVLTRLSAQSPWATCSKLHAPRFNRIVHSIVPEEHVDILRQEISQLPMKGDVSTLPPADKPQGFYSRYFVIPKRDGGKRLILDLRRLNSHVKCILFRMLTLKQVYVNATGSRLDHPLICTSSRESCPPAPELVGTVNKSVLNPRQCTDFLGLSLDTVTNIICLSDRWLMSILACLHESPPIPEASWPPCMGGPAGTDTHELQRCPEEACWPQIGDSIPNWCE